MSFALIILIVLLVALFSGALSYYYGDFRRHQIGVSVAAYCSWFLPMLIVSLLPLDISFTLQTCKNISSTNLNESYLFSYNNLSESLNVSKTIISNCGNQNTEKIIYNLWRFVYWSSQLLTWILLPLMQSFAKSGEFTLPRKLRAALIDNSIYYGSFLILFILILLYVIFRVDVQLSFASIKVTLISAANTWGLFLVIIFLGYGLVDVPRRLWFSADHEFSLRRAQCRLARAFSERIDNEEELEDCIREVLDLDQRINSAHQLRDTMDIIMAKSRDVLPPSWTEGDSASNPLHNRRLTTIDAGERSVQAADLVRLHQRLKNCQQRHFQAQVLWRQALDRGLWCEALSTSHQSNENGLLSWEALPTGRASICARLIGCVDDRRLQWFLLCWLRPWILRILAGGLAFISVLVVWSECTFWVKSPALSVFAQLVHRAANGGEFVLIRIVSFLSIGYLSLAVYSSVTQLTIFNYFRLVGNHQTDENSLIFCGMLLCRLTPSLCLNFLGLIHLDGGDRKSSLETGYTRFMGHLNLVPFIASGFNVYFPLLVLLLCAVTWSRLLPRCLLACGLDQLLVTADVFPADQVEEGRLLLRREKLTSRRSAAKKLHPKSKAGHKLLNQSKQPNDNEDDYDYDDDQEGTSLLFFQNRQHSGGTAELIIPMEPVDFNEDRVDEYLESIVSESKKSYL